MSMEPEKRIESKRDGVADLLKGAAVLFMIMIHLFENFATASLMTSHVGSAAFFMGGLPAAPVFMAVMGYYLARSRKGLQQQVIRGFSIVILGLVLNIVRSVVFLTDSSLSQDDFFQILFGVDILPLAGMSIIILGFIHTSKHRIVIATSTIPVTILLQEALSRIPDTTVPLAYLQGFFFGSFEWSYFPLFPWILYPLSGYWFFLVVQRYRHIVTSTTMENIALVAAIVVTATFSYGWKISIHLPYYYHHDWVYFFWGVLFLLAYAWIMVRLDSGFGGAGVLRLIKWVGKNVTSFYVVQWIIIGNLSYWLYRSMELEAILLAFAVITLLSGGIVFLWEKMRAGFATGPQK